MLYLLYNHYINHYIRLTLYLVRIYFINECIILIYVYAYVFFLDLFIQIWAFVNSSLPLLFVNNNLSAYYINVCLCIFIYFLSYSVKFRHSWTLCFHYYRTIIVIKNILLMYMYAYVFFSRFTHSNLGIHELFFSMTI